MISKLKRTACVMPYLFKLFSAGSGFETSSVHVTQIMRASHVFNPLVVMETRHEAHAQNVSSEFLQKSKVSKQG